MVFNCLAVNQDDHVKNISFIMDRAGAWTLSPAYDTFAEQAGIWENAMKYIKSVIAENKVDI